MEGRRMISLSKRYWLTALFSFMLISESMAQLMTSERAVAIAIEKNYKILLSKLN
jgi:hypothetical protein